MLFQNKQKYMQWQMNVSDKCLKQQHIDIFLNGHCCTNQQMTVGSSPLCTCDWKVSSVISSSCHGLRQIIIWFAVRLSGGILCSYLQLPLCFIGCTIPLFQVRKVLHTKLDASLSLCEQWEKHALHCAHLETVCWLSDKSFSFGISLFLYKYHMHTSSSLSEWLSSYR